MIGSLLLLAVAAQGHSITAAEKIAIQAKMANVLRDPASASYRWPAVRDNVYCFWVNAKNGFGGYTGFEPMMVFLVAMPDGNVKVLDVPATREITAAKCDEHGYSMPSS